MYRNLRTGTFSVKHSGKVVSHPLCVFLKNVKFKVSEKGRQRVLLEKRKNVHATIQAEYIEYRNSISNNLIEVYYNPYKTKTFVIKSTGVPVHSARLVLARNNKIYIVKEEYGRNVQRAVAQSRLL